MRRVERPAEDAERACAGAGAHGARDVPVALDHVLEGAQLAQPDRPARVQLLGRVADLGAHAELAAVGEARRGVDVDAGRVDAALEGARRGALSRVTIASEWPEPWALTCSIASSTESTTPTASISARNSVSQSSSVASASVAASASPASARVRPSTRSSTPGLAQGAAATRGRNAGATSACTSSVSAALHTPGRWVLALRTIRSRRVEVGARVDVDVAVARGRVDDRHRRDPFSAAFSPSPPRGMIRSTTPVLGGQLGELLAPAAGDERRARPRAGRPPSAASRGDRGEHRVGVRGRRGAAQHDRVARLQAQRGGVDRHVRARLVDDGDDAERHAHLAHVEAVGQAPAVDDLADRVGQRGDRAHAVGHRARRAPRRARRRSSSAASSPLARPASMSRALASRISAVRASSASAIASSARVLGAGRRGAASAREASRAAQAELGDGGASVRWPIGQAMAASTLRQARSSRGARPPRSPAAAPRAPRPLFRPMTRRSSAAE